MKKLTLTSIPVLVAALTLPAAAQAGILFSQQPQDGGVSYTSVEGGQWQADDFVLPTDSIINDLHWWGVYEANQVVADDFTFYFYEDDNGPDVGTVVTAQPVNFGRTATTLQNNVNSDVYRYDADLSVSIPVTGGTTYWLAIINDIAGTEEWFWQTASTTGASAASGDQGSTWTVFPSDFDTAFEITGVPVPGTAALLSLGLLGFGAARLRRQGTLVSRSVG